MRACGKEQPRKEDFIFAALTPVTSGEAFLELPDTFNLDDPDGYYQTVIFARKLRQAQAAFWDSAHRSTLKPLRAGEGEEVQHPPPPYLTDQPGGGRGGRDRRGAGRTGEGGGGAGGGGAGVGGGGGGGGEVRRVTLPKEVREALTTREDSKSLEHAPVDGRGKPKCWDAACHDGCPSTDAVCSRSHAEGIRNVDKLHWTVKAQLIKRGGVKSGPKVPLEERVRKIRAPRGGGEGAAGQGPGRGSGR